MLPTQLLEPKKAVQRVTGSSSLLLILGQCVNVQIHM